MSIAREAQVECCYERNPIVTNSWCIICWLSQRHLTTVRPWTESNRKKDNPPIKLNHCPWNCLPFKVRFSSVFFFEKGLKSAISATLINLIPGHGYWLYLLKAPSFQFSIYNSCFKSILIIDTVYVNVFTFSNTCFSFKLSYLKTQKYLKEVKPINPSRPSNSLRLSLKAGRFIKTTCVGRPGRPGRPGLHNNSWRWR